MVVTLHVPTSLCAGNEDLQVTCRAITVAGVSRAPDYTLISRRSDGVSQRSVQLNSSWTGHALSWHGFSTSMTSASAGVRRRFVPCNIAASPSQPSDASDSLSQPPQASQWPSYTPPGQVRGTAPQSSRAAPSSGSYPTDVDIGAGHPAGGGPLSAQAGPQGRRNKYKAAGSLVSVVIPVYNEAGSIPILVECVAASLKATGWVYEIICVDDGSRDGTSSLLRAMVAEREDLHAILLRRNFGQTAAMAAGMEAARGEFLVTLDGDLQNDARDIPRVLDVLTSGTCDGYSDSSNGIGWANDCMEDAAPTHLSQGGEGGEDSVSVSGDGRTDVSQQQSTPLQGSNPAVTGASGGPYPASSSFNPVVPTNKPHASGAAAAGTGVGPYSEPGRVGKSRAGEPASGGATTGGYLAPHGSFMELRGAGLNGAAGVGGMAPGAFAETRGRLMPAVEAAHASSPSPDSPGFIKPGAVTGQGTNAAASSGSNSVTARSSSKVTSSSNNSSSNDGTITSSNGVRADGTRDVEEGTRVVSVTGSARPLEDGGYDMVCGWRQKRKDDALTRNLPSRVANAVIGAVTGVKLHDYGCSLKAYRRGVVANLRMYGELHRFLPALASMDGASIAELPVRHHARSFGRSKYGALTRTPRVIMDLILVAFLSKFRDRPMQAFGPLGLLCLVSSIVGLGWGVMELVRSAAYIGAAAAMSLALPALVFAAEMFVAGLQIIFLGLIAEILIRTYFETTKARPQTRIREIIQPASMAQATHSSADHAPLHSTMGVLHAANVVSTYGIRGTGSSKFGGSSSSSGTHTGYLL